MNKKGSFLKNPKFLGLFGFLFLLVVLPVLLLEVQKRQEFRQHAATMPINGNNFSIIPTETTSCPDDGQQHAVASYGGTFPVKNVRSVSQTIHVIVDRYFCKGGGVGDCEDNDKVSVNKTVTIGPGQTMTFDAPALSPKDFIGNGYPAACGSYQSDIEFVGFNSFKFQSAFWCHTHIDCVPTSPTPTTPVKTPTPTLPITPTITITPTPPCPVPSPVTNVKIVCPNCKQ